MEQPYPEPEPGSPRPLGACKVKTNKSIIVVPGATLEQIARFKDALKKENNPILMLNQDVKMFKIVDGELFEVVTSLEKVKK